MKSLSYRLDIYLVLVDIVKRFSKVIVDILIPTNNVQEFQLFHILTTLDFIKIFIYLLVVWHMES